jgi:hypothetical protein
MLGEQQQNETREYTTRINSELFKFYMNVFIYPRRALYTKQYKRCMILNKCFKGMHVYMVVHDVCWSFLYSSS